MSDVKLTVIDRAGDRREVIATSGTVLMHVLRDQVDIDVGICGGEISCGTCLVKLNREWLEKLAPASADEVEMLDALAAPDDARLGCQVTLDASADGMQATLLQEE